MINWLIFLIQYAIARRTASLFHPEAEAQHVVVATRYYGKTADDFSHLQSWIERMLQLTPLPLYVAVASTLDQTGAVEKLPEMFPKKVTVLDMETWGYSAVLNTLLLQVAQQDSDIEGILFISPEVEFSRHSLSILQKHVDKDTLVAGFSLEGHQFSPGVQPLTALTSPWNTCALWNLKKLRRTGFLGASERNGEVYGMEEVPVISLQQHLFGRESSAKLIQYSGVRWVHEFSGARRDAHLAKMKSELE